MATKVFISWSGEKSKRLAEAFREWIPGVLQFVKPYFTPEDVEKGAKWSQSITKELDDSDVGVIFVTGENPEASWVLFEAGALSKKVHSSRVCTLLFDLEPTDVKGPLTLFQHTRFEKSEVKRLVKTINGAAKDDLKLDDAVLDGVFDMWWPRLETRVNELLKEHKAVGDARRSERDMLEEILELSRLNSRTRVHASRPALPNQVVNDLVRGLNVLSRVGNFAISDEKDFAQLARLKESLHFLIRIAGSSLVADEYCRLMDDGPIGAILLAAERVTDDDENALPR